MDAILILLMFLVLMAIPLALLWFGSTRNTIRNPLARGPRYHEGGVTYNQFRGVRTNIEIDNLRGYSARYQRRHRKKR